MLDYEQCPYCGSEDFDISDFDQNFDIDDVSFYWRCNCNECEKVFNIIKWYKLIKTSVQTEEEWSGE